RGLQDDAGGCSHDPAGRIDGQIIDRPTVQVDLKIDPPITGDNDWPAALKRNIRLRKGPQQQSSDEKSQPSQLSPDSPLKSPCRCASASRDRTAQPGAGSFH